MLAVVLTAEFVDSRVDEAEHRLVLITIGNDSVLKVIINNIIN